MNYNDLNKTTIKEIITQIKNNDVKEKIQYFDTLSTDNAFNSLGAEIIKLENGDSFIADYESPLLIGNNENTQLLVSNLPINPSIYSTSFSLPYEKMSYFSDNQIYQLIKDAEKNSIRKFEADLYNELITESTATTADSITYSNLTELEASLDTINPITFISDLSTFTQAKQTSIISGGDKFLSKTVNKENAKIGEFVGGSEWVYSSSFVSEDTKNYVVVADTLQAIQIYDYSTTELIIDEITEAGDGKINISINVHFAFKTNPNFITKTSELL